MSRAQKIYQLLLVSQKVSVELSKRKAGPDLCERVRTPAHSCGLFQFIVCKVELRGGGVEGQRLSYRPPCPLLQRIPFKVQRREDGVDAQRMSYRPPLP